MFFKKSLISLLVVSIILPFSFCKIMAQENLTEKVERIERVRWSGVTIDFGIKKFRLFGNWATVPRGGLLFGSASPYFRLNENDKTVFRGLGRENILYQSVMPTLKSRENLRDIIASKEKSINSLDKYDLQIKKGESIHSWSSAFSFGGKAAMYIGVPLMFIGISQSLGEIEEETHPLMNIGYNVAIVGVFSWGIGEIGKIISEIIMEKSFSHLNDAVDYFNKK